MFKCTSFGNSSLKNYGDREMSKTAADFFSNRRGLSGGGKLLAVNRWR